MNLIKTSALFVGVTLVSSASFAQKTKVTSAAVEFQKVQPALMSGDFAAAQRSVMTAKGFIDEAAVHEETKNDQKCLYYKGEIYSNLLLLIAQDSTFTDADPEQTLESALDAYAKAYPLGKKYKIDIESSVNRSADLMFMAGGMTYEKGQFAEAAEAYELAGRYRAAVGILDSTSIFNSALCYEKSENYKKAAEGYEKLANVGYRGVSTAVDASRAYRKAGEVAKGKEIISKAREKDPTNRELLLELVNANIESGDAAGAEKALAGAIATDPNNKQLHYTIGTIYIDLKENAKAEEALNKALSIDPNYTDAQYQLGAHLVTWAGDLKLEADGLKFGDPNYNRLKQESDETYKRALLPLEKYIEANPKDKAVLNILFQLHRSLGDSQKAMEYKKRADEAE